MEAGQPQSGPTPERFWPPWLPTPIWGAPASALLILIAGLIGLSFREPWLFPSLGPTAYILVVTPNHASARFYNTFVSHLLGMASGMLAIKLFAGNAPAASGTALTPGHVYAAVIAMALTVLTTTLARALHPPSAATTLLFALGGIGANANGATALVVGVAIVATLGEGLRLIRLKKRPSWGTFLPASRTRSDL